MTNRKTTAALAAALAVAMAATCLASLTAQPTFAASTTAKAKKAYKKAIKNGKIKISNRARCVLKNVTGDSAPELLFRDDDADTDLSHFYIYTYKNGKVEKYLHKYCSMNWMYYDASTKTFSEVGGGDGMWIYNYKLKNGKLKKKSEYMLNSADGFDYKISGKKKKKYYRGNLWIPDDLEIIEV